MNGKRYQVAIVGSGAGGATLARELSKKGKEVLVVEKGRKEEKTGTFQHCLRYYDCNPLTQMPRKSKEGVILWRTFMAGGSTVVSCANGVRSLERELADHGIALDQEFTELEREMGIAPCDERLLSEGSEMLRWAAKELGYRMVPMPKFVDSSKCNTCGQCVLGCVHDAKWTALKYLEDAVCGGAELLTETSVDGVLIESGKARGISCKGPHGHTEIAADVVVLAAGGLGTPVILQRSGIKEAGSGLFVDLLVNTYGKTEGLNQVHEPAMALVDLDFHQEKGFILSPFVNHPRMVRFIEFGAKALSESNQKMMGVMTKITDDPIGRVYPDGSVSKPVTDTDWGRLREGSSIAKEILVKAGADRRSLMVSAVQGAHPGGTAAIGKVVDRDLQTGVDGLFVCDASVLPTTPGLPPILTIAALAKRLGRTLAA